MALFSANLVSAQNLSVDRMSFAWSNMKDMVVNSAEAMPESEYAFVPAEGLRSFADQMKHIVTSNRFFVTAVATEDGSELPGIKAKNDKTDSDVKSKADIVKELGESFDYILATLNKVEDWTKNVNFYGQNLTRTELLMQMEHHLQREQGKVTIYMRMKGIAPAKSTSWLK